MKEVTAQGVEGTVDGKKVKVGKLSFVAPDHAPIDVNATAVYVSINGQFAGYITFKDQIRPETPETIARLKRQGAKEIMMLTGDHKNVAESIAKAAGISDVKADLLPKEKFRQFVTFPKTYAL